MSKPFESTYQITYIAMKNLSVVWAESQRPFNEKQAKLIAENFDPDLLDPLKVTKPNGEGIYHICDGQTRKAAAMMYLKDENQKLPCHVSDEGDPVRAAEIFLKCNTFRRAPSAIDYFHVAVTARQDPDLSINTIVKQHGYIVSAANMSNSISAVSALRFVYVKTSKKILNQTFITLNDIWPGDHNAVAGLLLRGFGVFLNEFGHVIDHKKFVAATQKWSPGSLTRDVRKDCDEYNRQQIPALVHLLTENYNKHRGSSPKLQRKEPKS